MANNIFMENLKKLHQDMLVCDESTSAFTISISGKAFSCIFSALSFPYCLFLTTLSLKPKTIEFPINENYCTSNFIPKDTYKIIVDYLDFKYDPDNPFTPSKFLKEVNTSCPNKSNSKAPVSEVVRVASKSRNIPDDKRIYFCGWRRNPKEDSVSEENFKKTKVIVDEQTAERFRVENVSSCWTDEANKERLSDISKYIV